MKAQNGLKFLSELCFGIMNAAEGSYLLNSKVVFLKNGQNEARICPFFLRCFALKFTSLLLFCQNKLFNFFKKRNPIEKPFYFLSCEYFHFEQWDFI